jgi:hypothetical protein
MLPKAADSLIVALADRLPKSDTNMSLDFKLRRWLRGLRRSPGCIPLAAWLRGMPAPEPGALPFVDEGWLGQLWEQHRTHQGDHRLALWAWLSAHAHFRGVAAS